MIGVGSWTALSVPVWVFRAFDGLSASLVILHLFSDVGRWAKGGNPQ
jgi:hypothetical protein